MAVGIMLTERGTMIRAELALADAALAARNAAEQREDATFDAGSCLSKKLRERARTRGVAGCSTAHPNPSPELLWTPEQSARRSGEPQAIQEAPRPFGGPLARFPTGKVTTAKRALRLELAADGRVIGHVLPGPKPTPDAAATGAHIPVPTPPPIATCASVLSEHRAIQRAERAAERVRLHVERGWVASDTPRRDT